MCEFSIITIMLSAFMWRCEKVFPLFFYLRLSLFKGIQFNEEKNQLNFQRQALTKLISSATLFRGNSLNLKQQ